MDPLRPGSSKGKKMSNFFCLLHGLEEPFLRGSLSKTALCLLMSMVRKGSRGRAPRSIVLFHPCHLPLSLSVLSPSFFFSFLGTPRDVIFYRFTPFAGNGISVMGIFISCVMFRPESSESFFFFLTFLLFDYRCYLFRVYLGPESPKLGCSL